MGGAEVPSVLRCWCSVTPCCVMPKAEPMQTHDGEVEQKEVFGGTSVVSYSPCLLFFLLATLSSLKILWAVGCNAPYTHTISICWWILLFWRSADVFIQSFDEKFWSLLFICVQLGLVFLFLILYRLCHSVDEQDWHMVSSDIITYQVRKRTGHGSIWLLHHFLLCFSLFC